MRLGREPAAFVSRQHSVERRPASLRPRVDQSVHRPGGVARYQSKGDAVQMQPPSQFDGAGHEDHGPPRLLLHLPDYPPAPVALGGGHALDLGEDVASPRDVAVLVHFREVNGGHRQGAVHVEDDAPERRRR